ncbi:LuxR C-terminal-related transcriptional regulator [Streptomyces sp. NPDC007971]|uniref:helix-turn-helix transcriptional regulator n=1 Tax=unclassified Streptomyces TaxID=2593676 RepID=UPI0034284C50
MTGAVIDSPGTNRGREPDPGGHAAHVEQTLLQARALIESTVSHYRRHRPGGSDGTHTSVAVPREALVQLLGEARHTVCVALTAPDEFSATVKGLLTSARPGPNVRVLCATAVVDCTLARLSAAGGARFEVRCSEGELRDAVVVDGARALVRTLPGSDDGGAQATLVTDTAAVRALELLFAGTWSRCRRLDDHLALGQRLHSDLSRRILERLRSGQTDDVAARELNVSLRTYRRHVAEIMRELGATSRFQAGARAVELGLMQPK